MTFLFIHDNNPVDFSLIGFGNFGLSSTSSSKSSQANTDSLKSLSIGHCAILLPCAYHGASIIDILSQLIFDIKPA